MNTFAQDRRNKEERSIADAASREHSGGQTRSQSADNRPETIIQRRLQETLNQSPKVQSQLRLQQMLNQSPRVVAQMKLAEVLSARQSTLQPQQPVQLQEAGEEEEWLGSEPETTAVQRAAMPEEEEKPLQGKSEPIQPEAIPEEEEEPLQAKPEPLQREPTEEEEPLQGKFEPVQREAMPEEGEPLQGRFETVQQKENRTGLPDELKAGVENLSGLSMDDVKVHYNSSAPATVQALAYTQGTEIHVGPGQEQHLAHEAWHVAQQKQGRVSPTMQTKGVAINDDPGLEQEADVMGQQVGQMYSATIEAPRQLQVDGVAANGASTVVQLVPMSVAITGITHLVRKRGKSIFQGDEVMEVEDGDIVRIETDARLRSRRGPNQEEFREEDRLGEHIYRWYQVLSVNGQLVGPDVFVREDTVRDLSEVERLNRTPTTIRGAMSGGVATASDVDKALIEYLKTGADVTAALNALEALTDPAELVKIATKHSLDAATLASQSLKELFPALRKFAEFLEPLGDGAREPALFFLNQLQTLNENLAKGLPPKKYVEILATLPKRALDLLGVPTEMGMTPMEEQEQPDVPEVGETMEEVTARYDVLSRKASASTRRKGAIHEVDLAMMPRTRGMADVKASIEEDGRVIIEPGQAERAFAIGYIGAITFEGDLSNQGGERFYGTLFPKGWIAHFSEDVRMEGGGSAREPSTEEFSLGQFTDKDKEITIEKGKAFLIRAEKSTTEEGQVTVHMDRNQLLFGGKPMIQFIREAALGVVEFNKDGIVIHLRMF